MSKLNKITFEQHTSEVQINVDVLNNYITMNRGFIDTIPLFFKDLKILFSSLNKNHYQKYGAFRSKIFIPLKGKIYKQYKIFVKSQIVHKDMVKLINMYLLKINTTHSHNNKHLIINFYKFVAYTESGRKFATTHKKFGEMVVRKFVEHNHIMNLPEDMVDFIYDAM